jgi:hypothetical protein
MHVLVTASPAGAELLLLAVSAPESNTPPPPSSYKGPQLTVEDVRQCRKQALATVSVAPHIIRILTQLRTFVQVCATQQRIAQAVGKYAVCHACMQAFPQTNFEPPCYISDRRLVKSVLLLKASVQQLPPCSCHQPFAGAAPAAVLLQVAAYCDGRTSVALQDCLLLQHVFWKVPEQARRIEDW